MRKLVLTCLASGIFITSGLAQTLFTYGNNAVSKEEFLRVYQKNSLNKTPDYSEAALKDYLNLYSLFRMKVTEAENEKLDTLTSVQRELDNYRKQLARNYLTDEQVTNRLIREAYDRMKQDVRVAHILIMCRPGSDTAAAYHKIDSIYHLLQTNKADFATLASEYSDDKESKIHGGDIGYVTALQTVYPFENAMYNTPVGKISAPFRTQFGYHIVKVLDKRPDQGEVQVAQILVEAPKSRGAEGVEAARKRADSVEAQLKAGASFESLVKKYSDDKFTVNNDGVMTPFTVGRVAPAVESAAFALKEPGDYSKPVQTDYGFHILKLISKTPLKPYDTLQSQIKRKVENDYRAQLAHEIFFDKVKQRNNFKEYPENFKAMATKFDKIPDTGKNANSFTPAEFSNMQAPLFSLAGKNYTQYDFANFAASVTRGRFMGPKNAIVNDLYKLYVNNTLNDFEEHKLVEENADFKNLMEEYKDGILLFELMDRNVWGKASKDTVGLQAFYEANKSKYMWEPGFKGVVYKFKDEAAMKEGVKMLNKKSTTDEDLSKHINNENAPDAVTIQHGRYEFSRYTDVPRKDIVKGKLAQGPKAADGTYTVIKVEEVYNDSTPKTLDEARGYVVAEYQDYLEKKWNEEMRKKYAMTLDTAVFNSMAKK